MKNRDPKGLYFRLCLVGEGEKWKEGDVGKEGEVLSFMMFGITRRKENKNNMSCLV